MRRTAIATAVILLVGATGAANAGARTAVANAATISVDPSTGLVSGQSVLVSGGGFDPNAPLASAECKNGAVELADCDLGNAQFPTADASGNYSFPYVVHAELITNNGLVDCTAKHNACMIGVASGIDITGTAVTAPISFAPPAPPQGGVLHAPSAPVGGENGALVSATDFAPLAAVGVALCTTAPADATECAVPVDVRADATGAFTWYFNTPAQVDLQNGDTIDCTVARTCVFAAWDVRDFASTLTTAPMQVAREVPGTMSVTPHTGVHDNQSVMVSGSGWPADDDLGLAQCDGTGTHAVCDNYNDVQVGDDGTFTTPFYVTSRSLSPPDYDCVVDSCSIVVTWFASGGDVTAARPIAFDAAPDVETAHYTADELSAVEGAASTLGLTTAQLQRNASWALAYVLAITHTAKITPAADAGPDAVGTNWVPIEHREMNGIAASEGATMPEFEKTGALFVAYILAISSPARG